MEPPNIKVTPAAPDFEAPKRRVSIIEANINDAVRTDFPKRKGNSHMLTALESASHGTIYGGKENGDILPGQYSNFGYLESTQSYDPYKGDERSWWYKLCLQCRGKDNEEPSWEPKSWPKFCPYPFCPTYRQFSRVICLILIGITSWCAIYSVVGETAAPPHGKLFQLILLSICAYLGGWAFHLTTLPALIGMLFTGLILQNIGVIDLDDAFTEVANKIRHGALVIILIRAGLDLDPKALWRLKFIVVRLSLIPWLVEGGVCAVSAKFFLGMTWDYSIILGSIISAVAPAVVVPCLFRLRTKGYGVAKGIPTLIIAVASIDDATTIAVFGIVKSIMFVHSSVTKLILLGPISIFGGFGFGILFGLLLRYAPERNDKFLVPFRIIMLLTGGMAAIYFSEHLGYGGAGPLGAVVAAFVSLVFWTKQGWSSEENPASTAFEIFWMIVEPVLFGITGAQIRFEELEGSVVLIAIGIVLIGVLLRILTTILTGIGCKLNLKEKIFCAVAWMPKATVQAALAPIVLSQISDTTSQEYGYAKKIVTVCILSIMITTTIGAALVTVLGSKLLRKTKFAVEPEQWRRSHRPSVRDISIIDEDDEDTNDSTESQIEKGDGNIPTDRISTISDPKNKLILDIDKTENKFILKRSTAEVGESVSENSLDNKTKISENDPIHDSVKVVEENNPNKDI